MQSNSSPVKIPQPFAVTGNKTATIPQSASGVTVPGHASWDIGFPHVTMIPVASGGIAPYGQDFNALFYNLTSVARWSQSGGFYKYDSAFASDGNVNGYPKGALLLKSDGSGYWKNETEGNTTNPDSGGSGWSDFSSSGGGVLASDLASTAAGKGANLVGQAQPAGVATTVRAKLQDIPSAVDFGAIDDGVTNDSTAEAAGLSFASGLRNFFRSLWMYKFPGRGIKVWKRTFGTFDQAAALSVTVSAVATEPLTYITGFTSASDVSINSERGSAAVFVQAESAPPLLVNSSTTFTSTTVASTAIAGILASIKVGMMVNVAGTTPYTGTITARSGSTITVSGWYKVDGSRTTGTPANGAQITINPTTKIWAHNANTVLRDTGDAVSATGFELGLFDLRTSLPGSYTTYGFDSVNLGNVMGTAAFIARGTGAGWDNGFQAVNCNSGFTAANFYQQAYKAFEVPGVPYIRFIGGSGDWFHVTSNGQIKSLRLSPGTITASITLDNWGNTTLICAMASTSQTITLPSASTAPGTVIKYVCIGQPFTFSGSLLNKQTLANVTSLSIPAGQGGELWSDGSRWIEAIRN